MSKPFILSKLESRDIDRGYKPVSNDWSYCPDSQVSSLIHMGETNPTTMSSTSGWTSEDETNADDEGTD